LGSIDLLLLPDEGRSDEPGSLRGARRALQAYDEVGTVHRAEDPGDAAPDLAADIRDGGPFPWIGSSEGSGGELSERRNGHDHPYLSVARFRAVSEPSQVL
jgi:hypothetical protein